MKEMNQQIGENASRKVKIELILSVREVDFGLGEKNPLYGEVIEATSTDLGNAKTLVLDRTGIPLRDALHDLNRSSQEAVADAK